MKTQLHNDQIFTLDGAISATKCKSIIDRANSKGWNNSSPSGGGHGRWQATAQGQISRSAVPDLSPQSHTNTLIPRFTYRIGSNFILFSQSTRAFCLI